jgi:hypothetical protein
MGRQDELYLAWAAACEQHAARDKEASGSYVSSMLAVGLKTLKNRLSEYVRLVANTWRLVRDAARLVH